MGKKTRPPNATDPKAFVDARLREIKSPKTKLLSLRGAKPRSVKNTFALSKPISARFLNGWGRAGPSVSTIQVERLLDSIQKPFLVSGEETIGSIPVTLYPKGLSQRIVIHEQS